MLFRAVAVAEIQGSVRALALVDALSDPATDVNYLFHAVRADLLRRLGRTAEAQQAYDMALSLAGNARERAFLQRRRDALNG